MTGHPKSTRFEASAEAQVKRGETFWGCAYLLLALVIGIEGVVVLLLPIEWWARIVVFFSLAITAAAIFDNRTTHDLIVRLKAAVEGKFR